MSFSSNLASWWLSFYKTFFWIINLIVLLLLLFSYLNPYVSPERCYYLAIIGLGYPFYLISNLLFIPFWFYHRERKAYFSLVALIIGFSYVLNLLALNFGHTPSPLADDYQFMTYNVRYFNSAFLKSTEAEALEKKRNQILTQIQEEDPDIFCGQEFSGKRDSDTEFLHKTLSRKWKYACRRGFSSLVIYSKYPIQDKGVINFKDSYNGIIYADIAFPKGTMRVYNMHLQSIRLAGREKKLDPLRNINQEQNRYREIGSKLKKAFIMRASQVAQLLEHIKKSPHPVVLCGDLNDTPISYAYGQLVKHLKDSFRSRGLGFGTTYAGSFPLLRIDYILVSPVLKIKTHQVVSKTFSDHYPVLSRLSF